ncbi:MAG TPA: GntR family transcriptional regulator [Clostridiales bacterium]|nr:GntR family transcriptional regulator [Clostridiales bacterium]
MNINLDSDKPIFIQIAEAIEDAIISGAFEENTQVPSITELSVSYKINPATALKGVNILVDNGVVIKRRGIGMFVQEGAVSQLKQQRKERFYDSFISGLISEAKRLGLTEVEVKTLIERGFNNELH